MKTGRNAMKRFWKKLTALALCAALCVPAAAAGTEDKFPTVNVYSGYADVQETDWFYDNAKLCYEIGIMTGTLNGFEPNKALTEAECVTLAARVGSTLRGETIPERAEGQEWWTPYNSYVFSQYGGGINSPDLPAGRWQFLMMLYDYVDEAGLLTPINDIQQLPDPDFANDVAVLKYYNAGILTGVDKYGTFEGQKSLTRAEAAAMVSRIVRPALRKTFTPADYSMFTAAYLTPGTVLFEGGVTAETFLPAVNAAIAKYEAALGENFNWHADVGGKTVLEAVKDETLTSLGVTADQGGELYKDFDYQVYYSRLIDLTGETL